MAIETKEDEKKAEANQELTPEEAAEKARRELDEKARKPAGPLDRAPELYFLMAAPTAFIYFYANLRNELLLWVLMALFVPLSFIGGIITTTKSKQFDSNPETAPASKGESPKEKAA